MCLGCWLQFLSRLACLSAVPLWSKFCATGVSRTLLCYHGVNLLFLSRLVNFVHMALPFFLVMSLELAAQLQMATALAPYHRPLSTGTREPDCDGILPRGTPA